MVLHYHVQGTAELRYPYCNSVVWQTVYHKYLVLYDYWTYSYNIPSNIFYVWHLCQFIFLESSCVSCDILRFFSCVFCRSFYSCCCLKKIINLGIGCMTVMVCLGNKHVRTMQCNFDITSVSSVPLRKFLICPSVD